jgi:hypothetical protein
LQRGVLAVRHRAHAMTPAVAPALLHPSEVGCRGAR